MKSIVLFLLWTACTLSTYGQGAMPSWVQNPPAKTASYYYRVSQGTGLTEEAATKKPSPWPSWKVPLPLAFPLTSKDGTTGR